MNRIRQTISVMLVMALVSLGITSVQAQRRPYRMNDRQVDNLIQRVETSADQFRATMDRVLDRSRYDGTRAEDNINLFIRDFESATDQLRSRFNSRTSVAADVENVLSKALAINDFMARNRLTQRAQNDWSMVRTDLNALAGAYNVVARWDGGGVISTPVGSQGRAYRLTDREVNRIITRIETNTDRFRASLDRGLDRSRYDGTRAEDNINNFIRDFEASTDQLRSRFNGNTSVDDDVLNLLQRAASIDRFMRDNRLPNRAQSDWALVRTDLNALADAYGVAWNWDNTTLPSTGGGDTYASGGLTGTYRIDPSRSDNARDVAERATRNLPLGERQRILDRVVSRLESPEQIAIERRGRTVNIASSRATQTTFEADGIERTEQLSNGVTARVRANLNGETLEVRSTGFRENDFTVTFQPIDNGRRLRVTRQIFSERLQQPVVVNDIYDKISETARFDIYDGTRTFPGGGGDSVSGDYTVRNGETLIATLETDLSTKTATEGQRFTMTVRSPVEYEGAVIEGTVSTVDRSGRVTGRSELSFNLDSIRLRDGRTHRFTGFVESVRTVSGETVNVDNEGTVRDSNQTNRTVQRTAIGSAVGAIIGAIAGGGKGAAIGAVIGAAGGAGSVYVQGRDDLELPRGTEFTIRASAPNR